MARKAGTPGRRSQAEAEKTRQKILGHAERLFARKGFRGVSTREIARACRVHHYTVQHHFGSKMGLYEAVLCRWDDDVRELVIRRIREEGGGVAAIGALIGEIFEFLLARHDWVALNVRNMLGEGLPGTVAKTDRSWVGFLDFSREQRWTTKKDVDTRLLLITVEGILHNHVLARKRYKDLFGKGLDDARLRQRVKQHLEEVVLSLSQGRAPVRTPRRAKARARRAPTRRT